MSMIAAASFKTPTTSCRILYSTQSGRAKACARRTARILASSSVNNIRLQNGKGTTFDQDPWLANDLATFAAKLKDSNALLILFVSTTGDGEQTDTIQRTWRNLLQRSLPADLLTGVRFCVFSLGDRAYGPQKFCAAGRKLTVRLRQLGAVLQGAPGYGDDGTPNGGVFRDLDDWLQTALLPVVGVARHDNDASLSQDQQPTITTTTQSMDDSSSTIAVSPPYRINVQKQGDKTLALDADAMSSSRREEWQQTKYTESYRDYFQKQSPLTAYSYNDDNSKNTLTRQSSGEGQTPPLIGLVIENERITADAWEQDTRHLRIKVRSSSDDDNHHPNGWSSPSNQATRRGSWNLDALPYRAGDVASILAANSAEEVTAFLNVLPNVLQEIADSELSVQFDPTTATTFSTTTSSSSACEQNNQFFAGVGYAHWPSRCTLRGWLTYCADIHALPEREDLRALSAYCDCTSHPLGRDQQAKLVALSETQAAALYADYVLREKRSWTDVLYDFDSLRGEGSKLTIEALFGLLPPIRPRDFSIASSPSREWLLAQNQTDNYFTIELCVAIVEGTTRLGRSFHGLCSHYLGMSKACSTDGSTEADGSLLRLWIRPGSFHGLPLGAGQESGKTNTLTEPVMFVGAGTGIAPLRGMILEREAVWSIQGNPYESSVSAAVDDVSCDNILVFGCRKKEMDYYYEKEWMELRQTRRLVVHTAFSRDQWHKVYVQQVLGEIDKETSMLSRHIIEYNGSVYIAGGPKMARAVKEKLVESLSKELNGSEKQAQQLLSKLQHSGRFSVEAWS